MGIADETVPEGWWIGFQVNDDDVWEKIKNKEYQMFSIEGDAIRQEVKNVIKSKNHLTFIEKMGIICDIEKFNPYHGSDGRFAQANGAKTFSAKPGQLKNFQRAHRNWKQNSGGGGTKDTSSSEKPKYKNILISPKEIKSLRKEHTPSAQDYSTIRNFKTGYVATPNSTVITKKIRNGEKLTKEQKQTVAALDKNMRTLKKELSVTRNVDENYLKRLGISSNSTNDQMKKVIGAEITEKSFISTSYNANQNVFKNKKVQIKLYAKKGTKAFVTDNDQESEIIFARNSSYTITGVRQLKQGKVIIEGCCN